MTELRSRIINKKNIINILMNESGKAVREIKNYYKIPIDKTIIVFDDLDLNVGQIRIKRGGGSGGHNGIKSIIEELSEDTFIRIRIGIGKPVKKTDVDQYVLSKFNQNEVSTIKEIIDISDEIIEECKKTGKPFKTLPSISELVHGNVSISQFREVSLVDLLGREEISLDESSINEFIHGKRVLITGAGGSIGSELVRQCIKFEPAVLVMLDISELNLFEIDREIEAQESPVLFKPILSDIRDPSVLNQVFEEFEPQVVFHAAAYKHVPMQEFFPWEAVKTNVFGTTHLANISVKHNVEKFVLVSTDKAVKPVNVMGATKRLAEIITLNYNRKQNITEFMAVRFGNVLGSSGSVIPIFQEQIKNGGPVTVTDPDMERYFMSIPEASQLILQAGSLGLGGEVFILDMGEPIKIIDIANELIRLSGYEPELDIPITFTGMRPGEKQHESLINSDEMRSAWSYENMFMLLNELHDDKNLEKTYPGIKKVKDLDVYSSDKTQLLTTDEITTNIKDLQLL